MDKTKEGRLPRGADLVCLVAEEEEEEEKEGRAAEEMQRPEAERASFTVRYLLAGNGMLLGGPHVISGPRGRWKLLGLWEGRGGFPRVRVRDCGF